MAENENGQEKTEEATPKRLEKARGEGQVARSKELTTTLVLLAGVGGLITLGGDLGHALMNFMRFNFTVSREAVFDTQLMMLHLSDTTYAAIEALLPFFGVVVVAALVGPTALGGFLFSGKALAPKLSRMNPIKGIQRMFSMNSLVELIKSIGKVVLVGSAAIAMLMLFYSEILGLSTENLKPALEHMLTIIAWSILAVSASMIFIAAIDVPYQIFDHSKKMKMTLQEVKDEMKDTEGKPEVKGKIRQLQREMAQRRMMEAVPEADVVITNPEHFSIALKYDVDGGGAPMVLAKGVDFMAIKIREIAKAHDIMILEAPPLARAIYFTTELDEEIPSALYLAVAQVLAYVFQLKAHKDGKGRRPKPLAEIVVPREAQYDVEGNPAPEQ
ncbi:flagellar biosynthesis protein FlhB [Oceanicoccus sagamiensis]|uniref:Flagellar biosynthetic protein FlhB n=1 Tax=Oceanicoccus sagamiensis TaxID=716816 RepID=A0A1X9NNF3_9GAMM|nr:flagellar biosynthesis protein FlhB [Oceanicoccus sagamiensis]ARN75423.1 flagellar biosynthesis protein FlhB [Oceanicoccus sagamiensis]